MTSHDDSCLHVIVTDGRSMEQTWFSPVGHVKVEHVCSSSYSFTAALSTGSRQLCFNMILNVHYCEHAHRAKTGFVPVKVGLGVFDEMIGRNVQKVEKSLVTLKLC
jgi:hypothetical protein